MTDYAVVNPATGETVASYDTFTDAQIEDAVARAASAAVTWAATSLSIGVLGATTPILTGSSPFRPSPFEIPQRTQ